MTVKELIEELQKFSGDTLVVVPGYEGGVDDALVPAHIKIDLNVHPEEDFFMGAHEPNDEGKATAAFINSARNNRCYD